MKKWLHNIEIVVDKSIPLLLLVLFLIIILEFGFYETAEKYRLIIEILDGVIVGFFVLDLIFKYVKIKNIPKFLRASWIEIIAVFPFFLVFRLFEGLGFFGSFGETASQTQKVLHVGEAIEKEASTVIKETTELSRAERFARFLRPAARTVRFVELEDPKVKKETKKDLKLVEKETEKVAKKVENIPRHVKAAIFYEKPSVSHNVLSKEKLIKSKKVGR